MPQTIALQRGSGSWLSSSGGLVTSTLFTQSGGISTRVIPIQLVISRTDGTNNAATAYGHLSLKLNASGAGVSLLACAANGSSIDFMTSIFGWPIATNTQPGGSTSPNQAQYYFKNVYAAASSFSFVGDYPANPAGGTPQTCFVTPIPQFWMGPGDSVSLSIAASYGGSASTAGNYFYSFVTITES